MTPKEKAICALEDQLGIAEYNLCRASHAALWSNTDELRAIIDGYKEEIEEIKAAINWLNSKED